MERHLHMTTFGTCTAFTMILLCILTLSGCSTPRRPEKVDVKRALNYREDIDKLKRFENYKHITIDASDIELPPRETLSSPADERIYKFSVWVNNPFSESDKPSKSGKSSAELMSEKDLEVVVVGTVANIIPGTSTSTNAGTSTPSLVQIQVESKDISQSFSIIAWFPKKYNEFEMDRQENIKKYQEQFDDYSLKVREERTIFGILEIKKERLAEIDRKLTYERDKQNPFGEKKLVRVFNGDLRTQIILASEDEVKNQFGKEFAKFFYVGRIYLRNQHADKKLIVYTTSIRAKTLLYREPNDDVASELKDIKTRAKFLELYDKIFIGTSTHKLQDSLTNNEINDLVNGTVCFIQDSKDTYASGLALEPKLREKNTTVNAILNNKDKENQARRVIALTNDMYNQGIKDDFILIEARKKYGQEPGGSIQRSSYQIKVNPSPRNLALSADGSKQAKLDSQGLIWEDYYRPMTFQTVLTSLMAVTESSWQRQLVNYLTTTGEVAAGLVGLTSIAGKFGNKTYSDAVAFGVGVILPETRKLLLDDLSQHISNLQAASLDTIREVPPNGVVDGYIYFPKGPIFGYGIDEFSITEPSFIVNIDNTDVQVEAALVEMSYKLESGIKSATELTTDALNKGISKGIAEKDNLDSLQSNAKASRLRILQKDIDKSLMNNDPLTAKKLLAEFKAGYGDTGTVELDNAITGKPKTLEELDKAVAECLGQGKISDAENLVAKFKRFNEDADTTKVVGTITTRKDEDYKKLDVAVNEFLNSNKTIDAENCLAEYRVSHGAAGTDGLARNINDKKVDALTALKNNVWNDLSGNKINEAETKLKEHRYLHGSAGTESLVSAINETALNQLKKDVMEDLYRKETLLAEKISSAEAKLKKHRGVRGSAGTESLDSAINEVALNGLKKDVMDDLCKNKISDAEAKFNTYKAIRGTAGIESLLILIKDAKQKDSEAKNNTNISGSSENEKPK